MKELSKLQKLQIKRDFHLQYSQHWGLMSDAIIQGLNKLIEQEKWNHYGLDQERIEK